MPQLEHHVVCRIHDVVDRRLPQRFEALPQPVRRRTNFHSAQNARRVAPAQFRRFNIHAGSSLGIFRDFARIGLHRIERQPIQRSCLACDAVMAQAIGAVRGQLSIKQRPCGSLLQRFHSRAGKR